MTWFYFSERQWSREVPVLLENFSTLANARALRHSVAAVEPTLYKGVKWLCIEDSAHFGEIARRFITESFFSQRNFWASYPTNSKFEPQDTVRPRYDGSLESLQDCLKFEAVFPSNVDSTGIFGSITKDAVEKIPGKIRDRADGNGRTDHNEQIKRTLSVGRFIGQPK
jgi:hypothetical protein